MRLIVIVRAVIILLILPSFFICIYGLSLSPFLFCLHLSTITSVFVYQSVLSLFQFIHSVCLPPLYIIFIYHILSNFTSLYVCLCVCFPPRQYLFSTTESTKDTIPLCTSPQFPSSLKRPSHLSLSSARRLVSAVLC